jgi:hypothetical protein
VKKLLKLALLVGGIAAVAKLVGAKKAEWAGLTESEVRAKLDARLPDRMPPEKQAAVADKVVDKMREKGVLRVEADAPESDGNGGVAVATDADEQEAETAEDAEEAEEAEST